MASEATKMAREGDWKGQALDLFEYSADQYDCAREAEPGFQFQRDIVLDMLTEQTGKVLDLGCGPGAMMGPLRGKSFEVVGVDYASNMTRKAHRRFVGDRRASVSRGDAEQLPFSKASFDHVICMGLLEYLPDYEQTVREINRVLRPGGMAIFSVPNAHSPFYLLEGIFERRIRPLARTLLRCVLGRTPAASGVPEHRRRLCVPAEFEALLGRQGFLFQKRAYSNYFVFLLERYAPELHQRVYPHLEPLGKFPPLAWLGCQYLVSAKKPGGSA